MKHLLQHEIEATETYCNISKKQYYNNIGMKKLKTVRNILLQQQKNYY